MRACSALVIHPDARARVRIGGLMRRSLHAVFLARCAEEARALLHEHPGIAVAAVAPEAGGEALLDELLLRRSRLTGFVLSGPEAAEPAGAGLDARLHALLHEAELGRERRRSELADRRHRRRVGRIAERRAGERLENLARLAASAPAGS